MNVGVAFALSLSLHFIFKWVFTMAAPIAFQPSISPRNNVTNASDKSDLYGHPVESGTSDNDDKSQFSTVLKGEMANETDSSDSQNPEPEAEEKALVEQTDDEEDDESLIDGDTTKIESELVLEGAGLELPEEDLLEGQGLPLISEGAIKIANSEDEEVDLQQLQETVEEEEVVNQAALAPSEDLERSSGTTLDESTEVRTVDLSDTEADEEVDQKDHLIVSNEEDEAIEGTEETVLAVNDEGDQVADALPSDSENVKADLSLDQQKVSTQQQSKPTEDESSDSESDVLIEETESVIQSDVIANVSDPQKNQAAAQVTRGDERILQPTVDKGDKKSSKIDRSSVLGNQIEVKEGVTFNLADAELELEDEDGLGAGKDHSKSQLQEDSGSGNKSNGLVNGIDLKSASRYKALDPVPVSTGIKQGVGQPGWNEALSNRVMVLVNERVSSAKIHLEPSQLGPIQIKITMQNDQASVVFVSHNALTRESIESALPRLREAFEQNGINLADVNVQQQESQQRHSARQSQFDEDGNANDLSDDELNGNDDNGDVPIGRQADSTSLVDYYV